MDYYTTLRRETVKSARFDPLIFLYAHLGDEGAFDGHVFSPNLRDVPVLMRLTNDDQAAKASSMLSLTLSSEREALIRLCVLPAPRPGFFIS